MDLNRNQQLAAIALIGIALIGLSYALAKPFLHTGKGDIEITEAGTSTGDRVNISVAEQPSASQGNPDAQLLVHVAGRVRFPNVYRVAPGARICDAIKAAGGSCSDANLDAVNLAAKVKDGEQVYVPSRKSPSVARMGSIPPSRVTPASVGSIDEGKSSSSSSDKLKSPGEGFVNINSADVTELQRLPGVGPSTAQKIFDYRAQIGRFTSADQLMDVKGIGPKKLEKMRSFISL